MDFMIIVIWTNLFQIKGLLGVILSFLFIFFPNWMALGQRDNEWGNDLLSSSDGGIRWGNSPKYQSEDQGTFCLQILPALHREDFRTTWLEVLYR